MSSFADLPEMVDTHCHLNFDVYDADREAVLEQARQARVTRLLIPAVDHETSQQALALAQQHAGIYAAVGVHPNSTADFNAEHLAELERLSQHPKVVAIGEIGLDYYWDKSPKSAQWSAFEAQLSLARHRQLPVIIHNREAHDDTLRILEAWAQDLPATLQGRAGVLHSFSAPLAMAERAIALGFYIGFTGPITFKKSDDLRRIAFAIPLERLLVETDAPYLTPEPHRGTRNSPAYIPHIVARIAALHHISAAELAQHTSANAQRLFAWQ